MAEESSQGAGSVAPDAGQGELRPVWPAPPAPATTTGRRWALAARIAATVGALLFFFAAWTPWATAITSGDLSKGQPGPAYTFSLTAAELGSPPLNTLVDPASAFVYWSFLTFLGVLIAPMLWQRLRPWLFWAATALYTAWAITCGYVLAQTDALLLQTVPALSHSATGPYITTLQPYGTRLAIYSASPAFGIYLATLALVAAALAGVLGTISLRGRSFFRRAAPPTVHGEVAPSASAVAAGAPAKRSLPGAGAVSGGLIVWAWGFFLLPWASLNCNQTPVLVAQCQGLPVASALQAGLLATRNIFDPAAAPYALSGLLLAGAAFALGAVWLREITRTLCAWLSGWVVFALACALIAINGAQRVVHDAPSVGLPAGAWRGDMGTLIVFLGLLLVVIGLAPLWAVAVRSAPRREPPTT